jgi:hypothetical protein
MRVRKGSTDTTIIVTDRPITGRGMRNAMRGMMSTATNARDTHGIMMRMIGAAKGAPETRKTSTGGGAQETTIAMRGGAREVITKRGANQGALGMMQNRTTNQESLQKSSQTWQTYRQFQMKHLPRGPQQSAMPG